eukprot:46110_1
MSTIKNIWDGVKKHYECLNVEYDENGFADDDVVEELVNVVDVEENRRILDLIQKIHGNRDPSISFGVKILSFDEDIEADKRMYKNQCRVLFNSTMGENLHLFADLYARYRINHYLSINKMKTAKLFEGYYIDKINYYQQFHNLSPDKNQYDFVIASQKMHCNRKQLKKLIDSTVWPDINVFSNPNATELTILSMNKSDFIEIINNNMNNINLLPIIVFNDNNESHIEYICMVKIFDDVDIGISLKYIPQMNDIKVTNIYLDKKQIQNKLIGSHPQFNCLNNNIYTLIINNDTDKEFLQCDSETLYVTTDWEEWEDYIDDESDEKLNDLDEKMSKKK